ncbi:glycoside hydrolase family 55 protein [Aplosporella prunicola CBS 121167]|uniref:Glycoside hydrolase family 55 protein n=1 Tax=Aplosporella prunicola CBS 121167 TaxID=1176127 RepID=A0A6A6BL92_9PEZI|nr:glycoside hydrolase family 55 protein [Aplosporella prunicola CBS 121167]KAF2143341.1 glycoside hydrolase family 55 protein [Aplosporella prunicola CBS 121167]
MVAFNSIAIFVALRFLLLLGASSPAAAVPVPAADAAAAAGSSYWLAEIERNGKVAFGSSDYTIFRNVKDYGAKGDGSSDDTEAINKAISSQSRCGKNCDSTTVTPALVYFPPGTYVVSKPIVQYYYTQLVGDAVELPVIKAAAGFSGMAVIDADPYEDDGANWFTNQNNFFRQIRNFVIDLTAMPASSGAGIHWQVAQATSLQNIRFEMVQGGDNNAQEGIFMDNGSGGFMADLTFNGGKYGAFLGSQQFTSRNLTFNNCGTAIFMNWNWAWTFSSININNCNVGLDMANSPSNQTVGSVLLMDSTISNTPIGVNSSFATDSVPTTGGTLILDNVEFKNSETAVMSRGSSVLAGNQVVKSWAQGRSYTGNTGTRVQDSITAPSKPSSLLDASGKIFERSKPQYEGYPVSSFVSIKSAGAKGDGSTDDTQAIQKALDSLTDDQILYFDHGAYIVTDTVKVPGTKNIKMTGEIWPLIMAKGAKFADQNNPKPVFQVGTAGDTGGVEMSDLIFETAGPAPGAILVEWNLASKVAGAGGMWDVHFRIGGSAGTQLQSDTCSKNPNSTHSANEECEGAFLLFHATKSASVYIENSWFWVADHELDLSDHNQIDLYNGRGVLIESQYPTWLWGTSSEHSVLYEYQLNNAKNVFMGLIQTETPYMQGNPDATTPFTVQAAYGDPDFSTITGTRAKKAWGLRIKDSQDVLIYGAGLYSFFDNYNQECLATADCQLHMVAIDGTNSNIDILGLTTKAAANMVTVEGKGVVTADDNKSVYGDTIARWTAS